MLSDNEDGHQPVGSTLAEVLSDDAEVDQQLVDAPHTSDFEESTELGSTRRTVEAKAMSESPVGLGRGLDLSENEDSEDGRPVVPWPPRPKAKLGKTVPGNADTLMVSKATRPKGPSRNTPEDAMENTTGVDGYNSGLSDSDSEASDAGELRALIRQLEQTQNVTLQKKLRKQVEVLSKEQASCNHDRTADLDAWEQDKATRGPDSKGPLRDILLKGEAKTLKEGLMTKLEGLINDEAEVMGVDPRAIHRLWVDFAAQKVKRRSIWNAWQALYKDKHPRKHG